MVELKDEKIRSEILSSIQKMGTYHMDAKYSQFLSFKNMGAFKNGDFKVSHTSYGKKYHLYLKSIENKNYCIFLNKKTQQMILGKFTFAISLFAGTLLDGELIKNSRNEWFFEISDLIYYEGVSRITEKFDTRQFELREMMRNSYRFDPKTNHCKILLKKYVDVKYLGDYVERYIPLLSYKCSGMIFKSLYNFSDNYTYIFPECRTDTIVLGGSNIAGSSIVSTVSSGSNVVGNSIVSSGSNIVESSTSSKDLVEDIGFLDLLASECEVHTYGKNNDNETIQTVDTSERKFQIDANTYCKFLVKNTQIPDIYELYCKSASGNIEKYGYAAIPNMSLSKSMKEWMSGGDKIMRCKYHKIFKKWVPYELHHREDVECIDLLFHINKVKIMIEKLEEDDL